MKSVVSRDGFLNKYRHRDDIKTTTLFVFIFFSFFFHFSLLLLLAYIFLLLILFFHLLLPHFLTLLHLLHFFSLPSSCFFFNVLTHTTVCSGSERDIVLHGETVICKGCGKSNQCLFYGTIPATALGD